MTDAPFEILDGTDKNFAEAFKNCQYSGAEIKAFADEVARTEGDVIGYDLIYLPDSKRHTVRFNLAENASSHTPYSLNEDGTVRRRNGSNGVIFSDVSIKIPEVTELGIKEANVQSTFTVSITKGVKEKNFKRTEEELNKLLKTELYKIARPGLAGGGAETDTEGKPLENDTCAAQTFSTEVSEELGNKPERMEEDANVAELEAYKLKVIGTDWEDRIKPIAKYIDFQQTELLLAHTNALQVGGEQLLEMLKRSNTIKTANDALLAEENPSPEVLATWRKTVAETLTININDVTQTPNTAEIKKLMQKGFPEIAGNTLMQKIYVDEIDHATYPHEEHALKETRERLAKKLKEADVNLAITSENTVITPDAIRAYVNTHLLELQKEDKLVTGKDGKLEVKLDAIDMQRIADKQHVSDKTDDLQKGGKINHIDLEKGR